MKQSWWIPHSPFGLLNRCSEGIGRNRSRLAGLLSRRNTASHRCYYKTQGAPPLSAAVISRNSPSASLQKSAKKQETPDEVSPKKQFYTSYGGIIRIRLRVEVKMTSSQPAIQAPLFCCIIIPQVLSDCKYFCPVVDHRAAVLPCVLNQRSDGFCFAVRCPN